MKQRLLFLIGFLLFPIVTLFADEYTDTQGLVYKLYSENTAEVYDGGSASGSVVILGKIKENGKTYTVTSIADKAFRNSYDIISVTIPKSITSIGEYAFSGCSGITDITFLTKQPFAISANVFSCQETATLHVLKNQLSKFNNLDGWKEFKKKVGEEDVDLKAKMDTNSDGKVNTADVVAIYNYIINGGEDDEDNEPHVLSGEWEGDWGMWYEDEDGFIYDADYTYIKLVPDHSNAIHGTGYQEDFYSWDNTHQVRSYYRYLWYKFDWEIRNGIIYLTYYDDLNLDTFIRDYKLDNNYFSGYFGDSPNRFRMSKLTDYYYWTPSAYFERGWYGYDVYYDDNYSKQYEGTAKSSSTRRAPLITRRGCNRDKGSK